MASFDPVDYGLPDELVVQGRRSGAPGHPESSG